MTQRAPLALVTAALLGCVGLHASAATEPIVIGQSLPLSGPGFPTANRVAAGAKAQVDRVNASGGLFGRPLELVTLDDGGDPKRHAANLHTLVRKNNAQAIVNCMGEMACAEAARAAQELGVPLVGPMSGAPALRSPKLTRVFSLRPDDTIEAQGLVRQLQAIGISQAVLLVDGAEPARTEALAAALQRAGVHVVRVTTDRRIESVEAALRDIVKADAQALVLNLGYDVLALLGQVPEGALEGLPVTIATLSSAGLTQVTRSFRGRMVGYTSTVPNPEVAQLPIVRELQRDADEFVGPEAVTFEGMESYLNLRLCTEALRRTGGRIDGPRLIDAIEGLGALDMGGLRYTFSRDRHHGSDHVEIGMRARNGRLLR